MAVQSAILLKSDLFEIGEYIPKKKQKQNKTIK